MKKKIFITGAVRDYDSANPKVFTDEIEDYIKNNRLSLKMLIKLPFQPLKIPKTN